MKNIIYIRFLLVLAILFISNIILAQPANPPADPAAVPIDGGLSILIAAGAAFGGKKIWDTRKQK